MEQNNEEPGIKYSVVAMETTEKLQRICSNVVGYCRTVMNSAGKVFNILGGKYPFFALWKSTNNNPLFYTRFSLKQEIYVQYHLEF